MAIAVTSRLVKAQPLFVVRRRVSQPQLAKVVPEACGLVWNAIKMLGIQGAGRHVALYLGNTDGQFDVEIGAEIPGSVPADGEAYTSATPPGEVATATHFGPYQGLGRAHVAIQEWCAANGRTLAGPSWEVYGHWRDEWNSEPSKIRRDIYYLVKT